MPESPGDFEFKFSRLDHVTVSGKAGIVTAQMGSRTGGTNRYCFRPDDDPEGAFWVDEGDIQTT